MHRIETARTQTRIASCPACGTHTAVSSPARCSRARLPVSRRSVLMLSLARFGISDGATTTFVPMRQQATFEAIAVRYAPVTEPKLDTLPAALADPAIQSRRRVGDSAIFPDLVAAAALGRTIPSSRASSPTWVIQSAKTGVLHMRLGTDHSSATIASPGTVRRVAPSLGGYWSHIGRFSFDLNNPQDKYKNEFEIQRHFSIPPEGSTAPTIRSISDNGFCVG